MQADQMLDEAADFLMIMMQTNKKLNQGIDFPEELAVTPTQFRTLVVLRKYPRSSMTELSELLSMQRQQLTQVTDVLVEKGLVTRLDDPGNRRLVRMDMTKEGSEYLRDLLFGPRGIVTRLYAHMTDEECEKFITAMNMLRDVFVGLASRTGKPE